MIPDSLAGFQKYIKNELSKVYHAEEIQQCYFILAAHVLKKSKTWLIASQQSYSLTPEESNELVKLTKRLASGEPVQYVTGKAWFFDMELDVNPGVLIPRPETEELVAWIISNNHPDVENIIDIGTGSGCIAIALKRHFCNASVYGTDISENALETACYNAKKQKLDIRFVHEDIFQPTGLVIQPDIIVSNPPYVTESQKKQMSPRVYDFEPPMALFVPDDDPLKYYKALMTYVQKFLKKNGYIYIEINELYGTGIAELMSQYGLYDIEVQKDINNKVRMARARK